MSYTVIWLPAAEDQLADIWLKAANRQAVTAAQNRVDALLSFDPDRKGDEVAEGLRQLRIEPLKVFYEINSAKLQVLVSAVATWP